MPPVEWYFGYAHIDIVVHILHGKNDRRKVMEMFNVEFTMPPSDLAKLLVALENAGRDLLTLEHSEPCDNFFVSGGGNPFNDQTFNHYWRSCMKTAEEFGIRYFAPSKGRSVFVEEYTRVHK